jgi:RNA polymerase sigma-70 factor (ECF subfamily)
MDTAHDRFRRLLEPVHARAVAFARGLCRSRADGDDLFQEAAVRALAKLDSLRDDAAFPRWFFRVVITAHRNRSRRAFWRRLIPLGDTSERTDGARPDPGHSGDYRSDEWSAARAEAARRARAALATLPAVQREAIVLFELEGWQVDEIAELQRVSVSAVKSRLARGRARLRLHYEHGVAGALPTYSPVESS